MDDLTNPQVEEVKNDNVEVNNIESEVKQTQDVEKILDVVVEDEPHEEENAAQLVQKYSVMTADELLSEMKTLYESGNFEQLKAKAALIRNAFNNLSEQRNKAALEAFVAQGGNAIDFKAKEDKIEGDFRKVYESYKEKRNKYLEEQEKTKLDNFAGKQAILEELRQLLDSNGSLKEIYDEFNAIQDKWKAIGQVPRTEVNALWENYHFLIEKFYDKVKISKELRDLDMKKNLEAKIDLCEKVESLIIEDSINKSFRTLQDYHQQWKEIGPVPSDKHDEIWERFKTASEKINARRQEYYDQKLAEMELNLKAKTELCERMEEAVKKDFNLVKDWADSTTEVNELLKLWRSIGATARKDSDALWARFKGSADVFFTRKKEFFDKLKEEQIEHFNQKVELCVKAEAIILRNDWKKATAELLDLQKQWKEVGYIQKDRAEKVWQRFRKACNEFFEHKAEFFAQYRVSEEENVVKKKAIIEEVKAFEFNDDKTANLNAIKEFQRRWSEIGFISTETSKQLWQEFRTAIDTHFDKLKLSMKESELAQFKDRISSSVNTNVAGAKKALQEQIQKLQSELNLWENNLGFLAKSKSADILRAEYEKKLEKIRQQIALHQAKLKLLAKEKEKESDKPQEPKD
ncbi:MAG: DUF349 domain-containing protein [Bacteroidales bacterium]|nr:DUF349 domain-containing protein [Bacteroidales bacterium]